MVEPMLSAIIHQEADWYVVECPELGTVSQGRSLDEALANLREASELYLEEQPRPTFEAGNSISYGRW